MACVRRAWLVLAGETLALEDDLAGYACTELDLGYPEVREVTANRAAADGAIDRTALFGSRAVSANVRAYGGTMTPDEVATLFAPYMLPANRAELHYVLERPDEPERMCTVRAAGYTWPISGKRTREVHLAWVAADPLMYDPAERSATAYAGSSTSPGRLYPQSFGRCIVTPEISVRKPHATMCRYASSRARLTPADRIGMPIAMASAPQESRSLAKSSSAVGPGRTAPNLTKQQPAPASLAGPQ